MAGVDGADASHTRGKERSEHHLIGYLSLLVSGAIAVCEVAFLPGRWHQGRRGVLLPRGLGLALLGVQAAAQQRSARRCVEYLQGFSESQKQTEHESAAWCSSALFRSRMRWYRENVRPGATFHLALPRYQFMLDELKFDVVLAGNVILATESARAHSYYSVNAYRCSSLHIFGVQSTLYQCIHMCVWYVVVDLRVVRSETRSPCFPRSATLDLRRWRGRGAT